MVVWSGLAEFRWTLAAAEREPDLTRQADCAGLPAQVEASRRAGLVGDRRLRGRVSRPTAPATAPLRIVLVAGGTKIGSGAQGGYHRLSVGC